MNQERIVCCALLLSLASCTLFLDSRATVGMVELRPGTEKRFELRHLPDSREIVLGLRTSNCELRDSETRVSIVMKDENNREVINEDRRLKDFLWMGSSPTECVPSFGFIRGKSRERPLNAQGDTCGERIYTGADYGYGTYFRSRKDGLYTLIIRVDGGLGLERSVEVQLQDYGQFFERGC